MEENCGDKDWWCSNNGCGSEEDLRGLRSFFKQHTECCDAVPAAETSSICESAAQLNKTAMFDHEGKQESCVGADWHCSNNDCGSKKDLHSFFKHHTRCCSNTAATSTTAVETTTTPAP